jgi:hypothetical protein
MASEFGKASRQSSALLAATRSIAIEGCALDHVVQTDTAQRLSEFVLGS